MMGTATVSERNVVSTGASTTTLVNLFSSGVDGFNSYSTNSKLLFWICYVYIAV